MPPSLSMAAHHNYSDMAMRAAQTLRNAPGSATFDNVAATVKQQNPRLSYQKRLLVNALNRLETSGRLHTERSRAAEGETVYVPTGAAGPLHRTSNRAIKKKAASPKNRAALFTLKAPDWQQVNQVTEGLHCRRPATPLSPMF